LGLFTIPINQPQETKNASRNNFLKTIMQFLIKEINSFQGFRGY